VDLRVRGNVEEARSPGRDQVSFTESAGENQRLQGGRAILACSRATGLRMMPAEAWQMSNLG